MRILVLTPQLPYPPRQGTTIRNYNLIRELARRHQVDLATFLAPGEALSPENRLHQHCRRILTAPQPARSLAQRAWTTLTSSRPDMALRLESPAMHRLVQELAQTEAYDIVQVEGIEMAQYGLQTVRASREGRPALIFDDHNCEYLLQQRNAFTDLRQPRRWVAAAYSLIQWLKLRRYEAHICRAATATVAVSPADREALQRIVPDVPVAVVPNGIDLEAYRPAPAQSTSPNLVFTGKMDYRPNIDAALWFGQQVLPRVREQMPEARFQIVGMNPHPRLDVLRSDPAVEITGAVPDTRPYIHAAAVYVIPMRVGGGTRFKALEAMACGKAIVSTRLGVEGIPVTHGQELLLADTPDAFAAAVVHLLQDQAEGGAQGRQLGHQARRFVEDHYGWAQIVPRLEAVYQAALQRGTGTGNGPSVFRPSSTSTEE